MHKLIMADVIHPQEIAGENFLEIYQVFPKTSLSKKE